MHIIIGRLNNGDVWIKSPITKVYFLPIFHLKQYLDLIMILILTNATSTGTNINLPYSGLFLKGIYFRTFSLAFSVQKYIQLKFMYIQQSPQLKYSYLQLPHERHDAYSPLLL